MFTTTDYDKLEQIMEESPQKRELLTRLLESQRMTISAISHEIRNPLALVYSTLQLIEAQRPDLTSCAHWNSLRQDIEYMKTLLEELSSYNNGDRLQLSRVDANTFLKTLALSFASSLIDTPIEFVSEIAPDLPGVQADAVKLRQVLLNLLGNAQDAVSTVSHPEPDRPSISLRARSEKGFLIITVSDNGCGIPEADLPHIFEPFVTHKENGTGLGLAIAKRIVTAHGGTLDVSSVPGCSSVFTLVLPV